MLQPIDYRLNVQSPFEAAIQGFKLGQAGQQAQAARQEAERTQRNQVAVQSLIGNPNATVQQYREVAATLPAEQRQMLMQNWEAMNKEEQASQLQFGGQVMSALVAKKPNIAIDLLTTRAQAERNAGREDKAKATESTIEMMRLNPDNGMHILGISMAGVPGFDNVLETALAAAKPAEADKPTAFQQDFKFIKETFGDKAASEFAQFGRSGIVSIPLGDGTTYVGPPSMAPGATTWSQQGAAAGQGMPPAGQAPVAAPTGQAAPVTQQGIETILNQAMQSRRMEKATLDTIQQALGTEGQAYMNKWLSDNSVRVIVRRGYDRRTGQQVIEYSDGKVEYGTD